MEKSGLLNNGWISSTTYLSGFSEPRLSLKDIATAEERVSGEITGDEPNINGMSLNLNLCGCLDVAGTRVNFEVSKDGGNAIEIVAFDNDEYGEKLSENYNYMSSEIDSGNYIKVFQQASEQDNGNIDIDMEVIRIVDGNNVYMTINSRNNDYSADIVMRYDENNPDYPKEMQIYVKGSNYGDQLYSVNNVEINATESGLHFSIPQTMDGAQEISQSDFQTNPARTAIREYTQEVYSSAKNIGDKILKSGQQSDVKEETPIDERPIQKNGQPKPFIPR